MKKGVYIVFEGIVGSGKSTQIKLLVERLKKSFPKREILSIREPGGTEIAEAVRKVFQGTKFQEEMHPVCEQYLVAAARAQSLRAIVQPALKRKAIIISDRSFFSSIAFQGFGRKLGFEKVMEINKSAIEKLWPQKVVLLDLPVKKGIARVSDGDGDKFESLGKGFFDRARKGYLFSAKKFPKIVKVVDGDRTIEQIHEDIYKIVMKLI